MFDRLRIRCNRGLVAGVLGDECFEELADTPLVGREVSNAERGDLAVSQREVHPPRLLILRPAEQAAVEDGLQDRPRLGGACQLGVDHLVTAHRPSRPAVQLREEVGTHQEVRASQRRRSAHTRVPVQDPLVDDVGSLMQRGKRGGNCVRLSRVGDLNDAEAIRPESSQHVCLMHLAPLDEPFETHVEWPSGAQPSVSRKGVQADQMTAGEKVREVACREPHLPVD